MKIASVGLIPKSCLTAVQAFTSLDIIPLIFCEDISEAFERTLKYVLIAYVQLKFYDTENFKLDKLTKSYLTEEPVITDRETGEKISFTKVFDDQTSPQGSSASRPLW